MKDHPTSILKTPRCKNTLAALPIMLVLVLLITFRVDFSSLPISISSSIENEVNESENNILQSLRLNHNNQQQICTPTLQSSYPQNVFEPVHDECPLSESKLHSNIPPKSDVPGCIGHFIDDTFKDIKCPYNKEQTENIINNGKMNEYRYLSRSKEGHCSQTTGMWDTATLSQQKCYFLLGMNYMNISHHTLNKRKAGVVLDWGTGCGHQIFWLYQYYGAYGFGLDLIDANKQYAMQHFYHDGNGPVVGYCSGDATDLGYIGKNMFDNIIAIGAVLHLPDDKQCKLVTQHFIRIVKKGGKIWIGWNGNEGAMTRYKWKECLQGYDAKTFGKVRYEIVSEKEVFGYSIYGHDDTYSIFITKQ